MAEVKKITEAYSYHIGHNKRTIPDDKEYKNESVRPELSINNTSIFSRGNQDQTEAYRKQLEKEVFKYNRKNIVHMCEFYIQLPSDCPLNQEQDFYQKTFEFVRDEYLPAGEKCILSADVHRDEWKTDKNGNRISKDHMHILFVPIVPDTKHDDFDWKLCCRDLTCRPVFNSLHQNLQKYLTQNGIQATVVNKKKGDGKSIGLSVSQLKEITDKTGIVISKSITAERLAQLLAEKEITLSDKELQKTLDSHRETVKNLNKKITELEKENEQQRNRIQELERAAEVTRETEKQSTWGTSSGWGAQNKEKEVSHLW